MDTPSSTPARANARLSFSAHVPNLQVAWDSTSLGELKTCPRKYYYNIVQGWQPKNLSHHLRYGQLYHRALEVYDHKIADGEEHEAAIRLCLLDLAEGCMDTAEDGTRTWWNTSEHLSEKKAKSNYKSVPNLFRTVLWYLDRFGDTDPAKTIRLRDGRPAVELSFRFEIDYTFSTGEAAMLSGHLDRVVEFNNAIYVLDRKTTATTIDGSSAMQYFAQYNPDNQMSLYDIAGSVALATGSKGIIIDAAQIAQTFSRFERGTTQRTPAQRDEWLEDATHYMTLAETYAKKNYWPMNDKSCGNYGGCTFRGICSKDPSVRETFLESNFTKRLWDPLVVRGDI
jgi:hypothetical protein